MKYKNLFEIKKAQGSGELKRPLMVDNDCSLIYVDGEKVYDGPGPEYLLREVLDLLEIKWEPV